MMSPESMEEWLTLENTDLIPKEECNSGGDFRPITCLSNLYKLITKCLSKVIQLKIEDRNLLSDNQLGTVRGIQGAKEQAMVNIAINKEHGNKLKNAWIDIKKALTQ